MKKPIAFIDVQHFWSEPELSVPRFPVILLSEDRPSSEQRLPRLSDLLEVIDLRDVQVVKPLDPDHISIGTAIENDLKILTTAELLKLWPPHCQIGANPTSDPNIKK